MNKINRLHVLIIFILFSVLLFLIIKAILTKQLITDASQYQLYGNVFAVMPYSLGLCSILISILSGAGAIIVKKEKNIEIHKGFVYSLIYSLISLLAFIILLIYFFISGSK